MKYTNENKKVVFDFKLHTSEIQWLMMMNMGITPEDMSKEEHDKIDRILIAMNVLCSESNDYEITLKATE